jgi:hypothetical protein
MKIEKGDLLFLTERGMECLGVARVETDCYINETICAYLFKDNVYVTAPGSQRPECGLDTHTGLLAITEGKIVQRQINNSLQWSVIFVTLLDCSLWAFTIHMESPHFVQNYVSKTPGVRTGKFASGWECPE